MNTRNEISRMILEALHAGELSEGSHPLTPEDFATPQITRVVGESGRVWSFEDLRRSCPIDAYLDALDAQVEGK